MITTVQTRASLPQARHAGYSLPPDVIFVTVHDGSARLLDMAGHFHAVPAVGALMLQETLESGPESAVNRIAEEFDVDPRQVERDLVNFLRDLEIKGLLCGQRNGQHSRNAQSGLARLVLRPALTWIYRTLRSFESKAQALLALARISFSLFGWTQTIAVWKEVHSRFPSRQSNEAEMQRVQSLDVAVRAAAARHLVAVECKERALCCWALARSEGFEAALVVGINLFPLAGHCWCEVGSTTLSDDEERCAGYTPVGRW